MIAQSQNAASGAPTAAPAVTMTSLELVTIINSMREPGRADLRHDHFMAKIENHPGIDSPKFLGQYKDSTGRTLKCYQLPKRECEILVMSESLAVQAKVYDRMTKLESHPPARARRARLPKAPILVAAALIPPVMRTLERMGMDKNSAAISANRMALAETGVDFLALAGHTHLVTPTQELCFTPTELGSRRCMSAKGFNIHLAQRGLQERISGHWVPTAKGAPFAVVLDTGKAHGNGTPIQQVKWIDSVMSEVAA
jgi:hypothetical protein